MGNYLSVAVRLPCASLLQHHRGAARDPLGELVYGVEGAARVRTYFLQEGGTSTANLRNLEPRSF